MEKINKLILPATILIASVILGGFYYLTQISKQRSIEKQVQVNIEQENQTRIEKQAEVDKQQQILLEKQQKETKIKELCSVQLQRNGNYLVSNETLNTNYNSCLHSNGL